MSLIEDLKALPLLEKYICTDCTENGFAVTIDPTVHPDDILIIKVDAYYNDTVHNNDRPKSPDCLIIQRCADDVYSLFVVELRDINGPGGFTIPDVREKFQTCVYDFMNEILRTQLLESEYQYRRVRLLFVTDPYQEQLRHSYHRLNKLTKLDALLAMNTSPFIFNGKRYGIEHTHQNPTIRPC